MSTTISLSEIVRKAQKIRSKKEKIQWLTDNYSLELKNILKIMYDPENIKLRIPSSEPPYTPSESPENYGSLYREARKLKYFVEGFSEDQMNQIKRENLFIQMLENVHKDDAKLLIDMIKQKPLKGLPESVLIEVFGDSFLPHKAKSDGEE